MADEKFLLQVITPTGIEVDTQVVEVEVPALDGEVGFLAGHVPYAGILDVGLLSYKAISGQEKHLVVKKGFCSFNDEKLTVLADATRTQKMTADEAAKKDALTAQLATISDQTEWQHARDALKEIEASESLS